MALIFVGIVAMLLVPLPPWEEAPERRWLAAIGMVAVCLVIVLVATLVHGPTSP